MIFKKIFIGTVLLFGCLVAYSQEIKPITNTNRFLDLSGTIGKDQGTVAFSYVHNWRTGKKKKFELGIGGRWTTYFGTKKDFVTAGPASLTRTSTIPFLIVFSDLQEENLDTLNVQRPLVNAINASFNMGYHFTPKLYGGINIDVIGFSFGRKSSAVLTSNGTTQTEPESKPASFNLLLTGDHDKGSLNSEFFIRYQVSKQISLKALYQFVFVEYRTETIVQVAPDGTEIDRFRNKANNAGLGIVYHLK
jgi:hypothetical protein